MCVPSKSQAACGVTHDWDLEESHAVLQAVRSTFTASEAPLAVTVDSFDLTAQELSTGI